MNNWMDEFEGAITLCDTDFIIVYMNNRSIEEFEKYGGAKLIGTNLLDCHNPDSVSKIKEILETGISNSYIKEKLKLIPPPTPLVVNKMRVILGVADLFYILRHLIILRGQLAYDIFLR